MSGYDYDPVSNSPYLRLTSKGDKVKIRLVSTPIHFTEEYEGKEGEKFAWIVIDRSTGEVKAFKGGVMIYKAIKTYFLDEDWGDPTKYDLTITRTEEKGNYYTVSPSPKKSDITEEEKKEIEEADIDLEKLFRATDKGTSTFVSKEEAQDADADAELEEVDIEKIPF